MTVKKTTYAIDVPVSTMALVMIGAVVVVATLAPFVVVVTTSGVVEANAATFVMEEEPAQRKSANFESHHHISPIISIQTH